MSLCIFAFVLCLPPLAGHSLTAAGNGPTGGDEPSAFSRIGAGARYLFVFPTEEMGEYLGYGHGGLLQLRGYTGESGNPFTRMGVSAGTAVSFVLFDTHGSDTYAVYEVNGTVHFDLSIFTAGTGILFTVIDARIGRIGLSESVTTAGFLVTGGLDVPLSTRGLFLVIEARYTWLLPTKRNVNEGGRREISITMNTLGLSAGLEYRI